MSKRACEPILKPHVVVLALASLGGGERWVDTEDIAVRARQLAPEAFSWRKYPEQVDLDGVRVALYDAAKERFGHLVTGSVRSGWSLTPAGVEWVKRQGPSVERLLGGRVGSWRRDERRAETRKRALERARVRRLAAWRLWEAGRPVSQRQAAEVFRVDSETPRRQIHLKVQRMTELLGEDPSVGAFVRQMAVVVTGPTRLTKRVRRKGGQRDRRD